MKIDPEMPPVSPKSSVKRDFEEEMSRLKTQLAKLPPEQKLPDLPLQEEALEEVTDYIKDLGLKVPSMPPTVVGIGGEFVDPAKLKEGRAGMHREQHVVAFLYRYPDKILRTLVVYPSDGIDIRTLALAIITGRVADVPDTFVQTEVVSSQEFFRICAYDVSKLIDLGALELFQQAFKRQIHQEMDTKQQELGRLTRSVAKLMEDREHLVSELAIVKESETRYYNSSHRWRLVSAILVALTVLLKVIGIL